MTKPKECTAAWRNTDSQSEEDELMLAPGKKSSRGFSSLRLNAALNGIVNKQERGNKQPVKKEEKAKPESISLFKQPASFPVDFIDKKHYCTAICQTIYNLGGI